MTTIKLKVIDENIEFTSSPPIYSGDVNTISTLFDFGDNWEGFTKTAVFYREIENPYQVVLTDDECLIPYEVMMTQGRIYIGVFGVKDDKVKTSEVVFYEIGTGVMTFGSIPEPSEEIWQQILGELGNMRELAEQIKQNETDFINGQKENFENLEEELKAGFNELDTFSKGLIGKVVEHQNTIDQQQAQIDSAINVMGDYEVVEEEPTQIRFKKGNGQFGQIVELGDGLATKIKNLQQELEDVTKEFAKYLALSGGTMSGNITLGENASLKIVDKVGNNPIRSVISQSMGNLEFGNSSLQSFFYSKRVPYWDNGTTRKELAMNDDVESKQNKILYGSTTPSDSTGEDGDVYIMVES